MNDGFISIQFLNIFKIIILIGLSFIITILKKNKYSIVNKSIILFKLFLIKLKFKKKIKNKKTIKYNN